MIQTVKSRSGAALPPQPRPVEWLTDNGSPCIGHNTRSFARELGLEPLTTAIQGPQSNDMAEAFVKTFKRDYAERMDHRDALTVLRQLDGASAQCKVFHPNCALKMLSPRTFSSATLS